MSFFDEKVRLTPWFFYKNWPFSEGDNFLQKSKVNPLGFLQNLAIYRGCQFLLWFDQKSMMNFLDFSQNWPFSEGINF